MALPPVSAAGLGRQHRVHPTYTHRPSFRVHSLKQVSVEGVGLLPKAKYIPASVRSVRALEQAR